MLRMVAGDRRACCAKQKKKKIGHVFGLILESERKSGIGGTSTRRKYDGYCVVQHSREYRGGNTGTYRLQRVGGSSSRWEEDMGKEH